MKSFSAIVAIVLATALPAFAQSVLDLPTCAQNSVLLAIGTSGCLSTDFECICKNKGFISGLVTTIPGLCTKEETYLVSSFAIAFCGASGVTIDLPASIQSPTGSPSTTSSVASTSSSVAASTTSSVSVTSSASVTAVSTTAVSSTTVLSSSTVAALTTSAPATTSTPNAGAVQTAGLIGVFGAVFAGVLAL